MARLRTLGIYVFSVCLLAASPIMAACAGEDIRTSLPAETKDAVAEAVATTPYATGNFWRATRAERQLTLIGTIHIDDPRLDDVAATFKPDIVDADVVYLEVTDAEKSALQDRLATDPEMVVLPNASLIELLAPETWATLAAAAQARGVPSAMAARLQPWYLSLILALPPCIMAQGAVPEGLDARIATMAAEQGVPTRALEPYDTLFRLFSNEPLEDQLHLLTASVMDERTAEDMLATTLALYFEEAAAELWHLSRIAAFDQMALADDVVAGVFETLEDTLLTARNRAWVEALETTPERRIVAAFGAAHLFGDTGVLKLLEAKGYNITRLRIDK